MVGVLLIVLTAVGDAWWFLCGRKVGGCGGEGGHGSRFELLNSDHRDQIHGADEDAAADDDGGDNKSLT